MKNQKKQLIMLVGILAVCLLAYFGIGCYNDWQEEKEADESANSIVTVINYDYEDITAFSYLYEDVTYSYTKDGDTWVYDGDTTLDMDESEVKSLLYYARIVSADEMLTEYEDLSNYGFDKPQNTITLTVSGEEVILQIGDYNDMVGLYYLIVEGDSNLYMIDSSLISNFKVTYEDLEYVPEETETETETETQAETEISTTTE